MNVYFVNISGKYIGGELLIIDETQRKAFNQAKKELESLGLADKNKDLTIDDIKQLDTSKRMVWVIDDGDY